MIALLLVACAPDLAETWEWKNGAPVDTSEPRVLVRTEQQGGRYHTVVDAKDGLRWVPLDFDAQAVEEVPLDEAEWDLRFQRFHVSVNGGISGDAGGEAAWVAGISLDEPLVAPATGWQTDEPDGPDEGTDPDYALFTWFAYDERTHVLTPQDGVWFVRATSGLVYALQFLSYYDDAGDSGLFTFEWLGPVDEEAR